MRFPSDDGCPEPVLAKIAVCRKIDGNEKALRLPHHMPRALMTSVILPAEKPTNATVFQPFLVCLSRACLGK